MKRLLIICAVLLLTFSASAAKHSQRWLKRQVESNSILLLPAIHYHNPTDGWNGLYVETEFSDIKRLYWDGTNDDGNGLHFDDEDIVVLVTFNSKGEKFYHEYLAYKVQSVQYRQLNGAFGSAYLYKLNK